MTKSAALLRPLWNQGLKINCTAQFFAEQAPCALQPGGVFSPVLHTYSCLLMSSESCNSWQLFQREPPRQWSRFCALGLFDYLPRRSQRGLTCYYAYFHLVKNLLCRGVFLIGIFALGVHSGAPPAPHSLLFPPDPWLPVQGLSLHSSAVGVYL